MEVAQRRKQAARDTEEAVSRDAKIAYEEERTRRMAQNQPLCAIRIRNIAPG